MNVTIYHNPRCSKSRQTLALLRKKGIEPEIILYLVTPPTAETLGKILDLLGMTPRDLIRQKEASYTQLELADEFLSRDELIEAMVDYPILIERPIVLANGKAALGRPPEAVEEIL